MRVRVGMLLGYLAAFGAIFAVWGTDVATSLPRTTHFYDIHLIVWILAWVSHALAAPGSSVFDANINWPAPNQLTGSEHFFAHQALFAPLVWVTGNPILAANLTTWAWYPIAATLFGWLALRLGARPGVAWVCGVLFALGPLRVPFSLHALQYPNGLLPLLALALARLRERPTTVRALALSAAVLFALLTSFYAAVIASVGAGLWIVVELVRSAPGRRRFVLHAGWAIGVAGVVVVALLAPYFARATAEVSTNGIVLPAKFLFYGLRPDAAILVVLGAVAWATGRAGGRGLTLLAAGAFIAISAALILAVQPLVVGWIAGTPLTFFRVWSRFGILLGFGLALLTAGALEQVYARWGRVAGHMALGGLVVALVVPRFVAFATFPTYSPPALAERRIAYRAIGRITARDGAGPLLELPWAKRGGPRGNDRVLGSLEPDAMLGSTMHWQPLVGGFTAYRPRHRVIVDRLERELPAVEAVADLVAITGLRWILLRPEEDWAANLRVREGLLASPLVAEVHEIEGFALLRLADAGRDPHWIEAIRAAAVTPGEFSRMGTRLEPLDEAEAVAEVTTPARSAQVRPGDKVTLTVRITNAGTADWPTSGVGRSGVAASRARASADSSDVFVVQLESQWEAAPGRPTTHVEAPITHTIRRDLRPGETITQTIRLRAPAEWNAYDLVVRVVQVEGATFAEPPSVALRRRYYVVPERGVESAASGSAPSRRRSFQ